MMMSEDDDYYSTLKSKQDYDLLVDVCMRKMQDCLKTQKKCKDMMDVYNGLISEIVNHFKENRDLTMPEKIKHILEKSHQISF